MPLVKAAHGKLTTARVGRDAEGAGVPCTAGGLDAALSPQTRVVLSPNLDLSATLSGHSPLLFAQGQWRWTSEGLVP